MGFFSNLFGKKNCCFCNQEVGALKRDKIRNKEYICNECKRKVSQFVRVSEMDKAEIEAHMKFMERREKIYKEVLEPMNGKLYAADNRLHSIRFYDDAGMFIINSSLQKEYHEVFRYDEVESWEYYKEENPGQNGAKPTFKEDGVKLHIKAPESISVPSIGKEKAKGGTRPHPYIKREIKLTIRKDQKKSDEATRIIAHFGFIYGIHDGDHALFGGMSKEEKRNFQAGVESFKLAGSLLKSAAKGELDPNNIDPEMQAKADEVAKLQEDAKMGAIAKYMRSADEIEARYPEQ
ncbi:MAG: hypothetical protein MJ166_03635 [Clostridia bacterium]|nr:hypothetical protein [Clostridia bacterium]